MNYIAITEVREVPEYQEPKQYTSEEISKIMSEALLTPISTFKQEEPIKRYLSIRLTEDTFNFIQQVANIGSPVFGEKEYIINNLKFHIYTEEDYEKRYGKLE